MDLFDTAHLRATARDNPLLTPEETETTQKPDRASQACS